jgi:hypothetical protein
MERKMTRVAAAMRKVMIHSSRWSRYFIMMYLLEHFYEKAAAPAAAALFGDCFYLLTEYPVAA